MSKEGSEVIKAGSENKTSYRSIFKATTILGSVQLYQIVMTIIKSKFVAVLLGPAGVGIQGLYTTATGLVERFSCLGLGSSAVRNVADANASKDQDRINRVVSVLRKLVWFTGLLGMFLVIVLSPILSKASFGDYSHIVAFIILSVTLLINQQTSGQNVLLQGTRRLKDLGKASAIGVTLGLIISVPLFYFFGIEGIVPSIILTSLSTYLIARFFARKVQFNKVNISLRDAFSEGRSMMTMGIAMSLSSALATLCSYALRGSIRMMGGLEQVGLFTAGFALMTQYTGLIFTAMSTDFYPRLSAVNTDNEQCRKLVNQQSEIGLLILSPLMCICIIFIPFVVILLYSQKFLGANDFIVWSACGMLFKMASWAIGYILLAKGESKLFMITEFINSGYTLLLNLLGYKLGGLAGLGISSIFSFIIYWIMIYVIANKRYGFSYTKSFVHTFVIHLLLITGCLFCVYTLTPVWKYTVGTTITIVSGWISLHEMNKKMDLKAFVRSKLNREKR